MKIKISAVIPVAQYANIQPEVEIEADTYEQAFADGMAQIEKVWDKYGEKPLVAKQGNRKLIDCFVGGQIYFDEVTHTYTNEAGDVYLSGSVFAHQGEKPFDAVNISNAMGKKNGKDPQFYLDMWKLNGDCSKGFGTAVHEALELFFKYGELHKHPILKNAVQSFVEAHKEKSISEAMIVDHDKKHAGQVDRLVILGDKHCRIEDFKTDGDITKKLESYWKQLNFYGGIMESHGWKVEAPVIHHWNGSWKQIKEEERYD